MTRLSSRVVSGAFTKGGDRLLPSFLTYRAAALADRTGNGIGNGATRWGESTEFSLPTLACLGLAAGDSAGVCSCLCFEGGIPSAATTVSSWGDGVDRDKGLLLCIDDNGPEGVVYKELRARVRLPSMFYMQLSACPNIPWN